MINTKHKQVYNFHVNTTNLTCLLRKSENENITLIRYIQGILELDLFLRGMFNETGNNYQKFL